MERSIIWIKDVDNAEIGYYRLEAFEMWLWRKIMKVKWTEHKTNEDVLEMVRDKRMLMKTVRDTHKSWVGHVLKCDSLLQTVWEGRMEGKKVVGRQERRYLTGWYGETNGGTYEDLKKLALDRTRWRT